MPGHGVAFETGPAGNELDVARPARTRNLLPAATTTPDREAAARPNRPGESRPTLPLRPRPPAPMPTPAPDPGPTHSAFRRFVATLLAQALGRAEGPDPVPQTERRRATRRPAPPGARAVVHLGTAGPSTDVALGLVDVSEDGAGLRLRTPVRPGESAHLALWSPDRSEPIRRWAAVVWCRPAPGGSFRAGVTFRRPLSPDDLQLLAH
jgi:hypothetical protein